jgi:hypothetical protein
MLNGDSPFIVMKSEDYPDFSVDKNVFPYKLDFLYEMLQKFEVNTVL